MFGDNMTYAAFVDVLFKRMGSPEGDAMHAAAGIAGEAGEIIDAVKKNWAYNKPLDKDNVIEELGDILFYVQAMASLMEVSLSECIVANMNKLQIRYPQGYTDAAAIARADKQ